MLESQSSYSLESMYQAYSGEPEDRKYVSSNNNDLLF